MSEKNSKLDDLFEKLEQGVMSVYTSEGYIEYLRCMARFHKYSLRNCLLIYLQKPEATLCAGYNTWKKQGRHVVAGQRAITIIGGSEYTFDAEEVNKKTGEIENVKHKGMRFFPVSVFDISQTEGKELPLNLCVIAEGDCEKFEDLREKLVKVSPVSVSFEPTGSDANGFYNPVQKRIVVRDDMPQVQTIKTLVHEIAHAKFDHNHKDGKTRGLREVEAESVAFVVCCSLGLDTSSYSFPYVATWAKDKEATELLESQESIMKVASEIIKEVTKKKEEKEAA